MWRAIPAVCISRYFSGIKMVKGCPSASSSVKPKILCAPLFHERMLPLLSAAMMASLADCATERNLSSDCCNASSARLRSVMSSIEPIIRKGLPCPSRTTIPRSITVA
jgi:hypothetical protein